MTNLRNDLIGMTSDSSKQLLQQHLIQKRTVHTADSSFLRSIRISFSFILRSSFLLLIFLFLHEHTLHNHGQRLKLVMSHFGEGEHPFYWAKRPINIKTPNDAFLRIVQKRFLPRFFFFSTILPKPSLRHYIRRTGCTGNRDKYKYCLYLYSWPRGTSPQYSAANPLVSVKFLLSYQTVMLNLV